MKKAIITSVAMIMLVLPAIDRASGDFSPLSLEEYARLKKDDAQRYLSELENAFDEAGARESAARARIEEEEKKIEDLQSRSGLSGLNSTLASLQQRYDSIMGEVSYFRNLPKTHTVVKGEYLYKIAGYEEIYADPVKWPRIYRANRDLIRDPNLIYPDWVLQIPRDWPTAHTVREGESLSRIASYWEIYGSARKWPELYEQNSAQIKDPDLIHPDQVFTFPKDR